MKMTKIGLKIAGVIFLGTAARAAQNPLDGGAGSLGELKAQAGPEAVAALPPAPQPAPAQAAALPRADGPVLVLSEEEIGREEVTVFLGDKAFYKSVRSGDVGINVGGAWAEYGPQARVVKQRVRILDRRRYKKQLVENGKNTFNFSDTYPKKAKEFIKTCGDEIERKVYYVELGFAPGAQNYFIRSGRSDFTDEYRFE